MRIYYLELVAYNVGLRKWRRRRRISRLSATFQCRVMSEDIFSSPIFFLQLFLAVALDRRLAWLRVLPLNYLSSPCTLTNHILATRAFWCMSTTQSVCCRTGDPRQIAVSDLSRVILWLVVPRFEHSTLWECVEQLNHSAIAAFKKMTYQIMWVYIVRRKNLVTYL
jgi:hypothetical protein